MSLKSHHLPLCKKLSTLLSPVPLCTDSLMLNWNSDSSLMSEPNYVLVEGIDYDLPPGTPWRLEQEGPPLILNNDPHLASDLILLPSSYSYNPWPERTTRFPVCLELSDQGPPGDYMSLLLYCRFHSQTMGYIILEWCAYIYFHNFISAMAAVQQQNNLYTAYIAEGRAFAELDQGEITSWYGYDYRFESMPFWKARHQHVNKILSDINFAPHPCPNFHHPCELAQWFFPSVFPQPPTVPPHQCFCYQFSLKYLLYVLGHLQHLVTTRLS